MTTGQHAAASIDGIPGELMLLIGALLSLAVLKLVFAMYVRSLFAAKRGK